jgi:hypothetical protein
MRDIRSDWYESRNPDAFPPGRLVVCCAAAGCGHAAVVDPRHHFRRKADWPEPGPSRRFRCVCGGRDSVVRYTANTRQANGPVSADVARCWL